MARIGRERLVERGQVDRDVKCFMEDHVGSPNQSPAILEKIGKRFGFDPAAWGATTSTIASARTNAATGLKRFICVYWVVRLRRGGPQEFGANSATDRTQDEKFAPV